MDSETITRLFRINNKLCDFSPNGKYIACAFQTNLTIINNTTFNVVTSFTYEDLIECIEWSNNSEYILCASIKKGTIQVYSINDPNWKCKLIVGSAGLERVTWSPDYKHIIILAEFNIQISVWSLEHRSVTYIHNLKSSVNTQLNFTPNGKKLAVITRINDQDNVEIYNTKNWTISRKLICERLDGIDGICWSPNNELLCIWCSFSGIPKLIIYSTVLEKNIAVYCPEEESKRRIRNLIGIESVKWCSNGQLLAMIGYNEAIVLLNYVTWKPILQFHLDPVIVESHSLSKVYKEYVIKAKETEKHTFGQHKIGEEYTRPINVYIDKKNNVDLSSIAYMEIFEFSPCGQYLALKHQLYPTTVWIWDIIMDHFDCILLRNNITAIQWNPIQPCLLIFCACTNIFKWIPEDIVCLQTPKQMTALDGKWFPDGKLVLVYGYNKAFLLDVKNV